jgi:hypothetical protein
MTATQEPSQDASLFPEGSPERLLEAIAQAIPREGIAAKVLRRVDLASFWSRLAPVLTWLDGELQRVAAQRRFALVMILDADDARTAHEMAFELLTEHSGAHTLVSVGPACPITVDAETYETEEIVLRTDGARTSARPTER